jgi:alpha-L-fucosidase
MKTLVLAVAVLGLLGLPIHASPSKGPSEPPEGAAAERIGWWLDAKFGLFIHWGPVSLTGTEIGWSRAGNRRGFWGSKGTEVPTERYDNLYKEFNPVNYDPATWVAIAKAAGMKYIVLVSRHHDGFSLWDTQASDHKITSPLSPYGKDIVGPLAEATRAAGLRFGVYYSQPDWRHPDAFTERHPTYLAYLEQQLRELMTNYGQIDIVWFDGLGKKPEEYGSVALNKIIRELQPRALINNRNGSHEDFDTPEQRVGTMEVKRPWETCMTIGRRWSWKPDDQLKSFDECVRILVSTVTGGGNLLLNVGPMPDGRIEPRQVARLNEIGAWTTQNGAALYNTRGGPWANGSWGGSTYRDRTIYVHLLQPPLNNRIRLAPLPHPITSARLFQGTRSVAFTQSASGVTLDLAADSYHGPVTILELTTAEPVAPYQNLGTAAGQFDDASTFGTARQANASVTLSTGTATKSDDERLTIKTAAESKPSYTLDLGTTREITAFSAVAIDFNAHNSNAELVLELSPDGQVWEKVYQGSYGLAQWEIPLTRFVAGIQHPGIAARYARFSIDYHTRQGSLQLGRFALYAR